MNFKRPKSTSGCSNGALFHYKNMKTLKIPYNNPRRTQRKLAERLHKSLKYSAYGKEQRKSRTGKWIQQSLNESKNRK